MISNTREGLFVGSGTVHRVQDFYIDAVTGELDSQDLWASSEAEAYSLADELRRSDDNHAVAVYGSSDCLIYIEVEGKPKPYEA